MTDMRLMTAAVALAAGLLFLIGPPAAAEQYSGGAPEGGEPLTLGDDGAADLICNCSIQREKTEGSYKEPCDAAGPMGTTVTGERECFWEHTRSWYEPPFWCPEVLFPCPPDPEYQPPLVVCGECGPIGLANLWSEIWALFERPEWQPGDDDDSTGSTP